MKKFNIDSKVFTPEDLPPKSIIWTTLPIISAYFPVIGHVGVTDSHGNTHDFAGSFTINYRNFSFNKPLKYI